MRPRRNAEALLLPPAFAAAPIEFKMDSDDLLKLYGGEPAEYALEGLRGTFAGKGKPFTFEERRLLDHFNKQCDVLIRSIHASCCTLDINQYFLNNLNVFSKRFQSRTDASFAFQSSHYYAQIKQALEIIAIYLLHSVSNKSNNNSKAKRILEDLLRNIANCGSGIFNHINAAKLEIVCPTTPEAWLAQLRRTLILHIADRYLKKENISEGVVTHVQNVFLQYAYDEGWNPYDGESLKAMKEIYAGLAPVTAEGWRFFRDAFFQEYTPKAIMRALAEGFIRCIYERVKKRADEQHGVGDIVFTDFLDFQNFFAGLPIILEEGGMYWVFDYCEDEEERKEEEKTVKKNDSLSIILMNSRLRLKSMPALMLSLMEYYRNKGTPFFQTYQDELQSLTLVYGTPELSYKHPLELGGAPIPLDDKTVLPVGFSVLKRFKIPLFNGQFHSYYAKGCKNFSEYTLINVDFTEIDIVGLNFKDAQFVTPKFTSDQYVHLYHTYFLSQLSDRKKVEHFRNPSIAALHTLAQKGNAEIICLLFKIGAHFEPHMTPLQYAAQQGNVQAVRLLLDTNVCAHLKNITENTSILLAARAGHWECVDLFIETKENIPSYWRVLPRAAKANNFDIVKKLLKEIKGKNNLSGYLISEKMTALHYAVKNDNEEMVHMLLDTGANLNSRDKEGNTPLHIAAQYGNTKIVHVLLTRGANPCGVNNKDMRPIQLASVGGQWECVKVFIQAGRNTSNYESILLYAAWKNQRDVVLMLLQQDDFFEVDLPFSDTRETALHYAARDGHTEIVQLLLEKGASSNCRDYQGRMAVHNAAERGHAEIVQLLLNASFREMEGEDTAIALAARNHHWDCVRMFIEEKRGGGQYGVILLYAAEADRLDVVEALLHVSSNLGIKYGVKHRGRTTLHYAAQHGDVKMVSLFLERGADPHWKDRDKNRPIDLALERGHWECVEKLAQFVHKNKHAETISALIQTGKNLENNPRKFKIYISLIRYFVRNSWGDSWTSQPTSERRLENIKALLKILENSEEADFLQNIRQYCDTKIKTSSISTRSALRTDVLEAVSVCADIDLLSAAEANQLDIVEKLLDINNGIHFRKIGGITALHCAAKNGNAKMVEALLRAGANPTLEDNGGNKPLILAARKDHWDCVGIFLRMKKYSSDEDLVLWYAAQANNLEIVRMIGLLKRQGMVSGRDKATQKTALHFAAQHGNAEMVRELSPTYHDDLHWFDKNGHTPLHIAGENNRAEVVDILLKAGASPRLKDRNGYMPIQLAIERGHWECVEKLARFMHGDKHRHIIDTFIRIGRNLENNENDKKLRTYNAVINYFIGDPLSVSWTSQPTSDRRLEDIKALLEMIEKDEDNPEDDFEEGVRQYCATQIKTSHRFGFFNRSALRDSVLEACSSASSSPLGMRRGAGAAAA